MGDYSAYRHNVPGKGELVLCYKCKQWADRHPGQSNFPPKQFIPFAEGKRIRTFANIYIISSLGVFALGAALVVAGGRSAAGILFLLGALSLFLIGLGMRKFIKK
jgi:hypothetical protein